MPWTETSVMDERMWLVKAYGKGERSFTDLCRDAGVSRKTGYKWVARYAQERSAGLSDRSRAPHVQGRKVDEEIEQAIVALKQRRPHYGPKKLRVLLEQRDPKTAWPAVSTIGGILARHGLVKRIRRARKTPRYTAPLRSMDAPNAVWTIDIKGQFKTGDGKYCYPLTIVDGYSRFLLCCLGMPEISRELVQPGIEATFREYGLPEVIRTDNGPPFANRGLGISRLTAWWMKLGILHERIEPGHPEQNGRHERMHRTLKAETTKPPAANLHRQQRRMDTWSAAYNFERPHEAHGQRPPSSQFEGSRRPLPVRLPPIAYPGDYIVRQVRQNGAIKWHSRLIYVCTSLTGEPVGLQRIDEERWRVHFTDQPIGIFDEHLNRVLPM